MIKYELFSINCISSNINWQAKTVYISHNIKYFMVSIEHYGFNDKLSYELNNELNNESTLNLPITYSESSLKSTTTSNVLSQFIPSFE